MSVTYGTPIVGTAAVVTFEPLQADGSFGTAILLKNSDYDITPKSNNKEAPNTSDGMLRAPGLRDYEGSVKGHTDVSGTNNLNAVESNVMAGSIGRIKCYRNYSTTPTGSYWGGTVIFGDLKISTGVDQTEDWEFSFAKQSGPLTLPNGTTW